MDTGATPGFAGDMASTPSEIRVERADDAARYLATDKLVWFDGASTEPVDVETRGVPESQRFYAEVVGSDVDPATYPGIYGVRPMQLSVPDGSGAGQAVPVAGLTWVGVHPDHRRRGLLTAMLRHHVEQTRAEGLHLSGLHASEAAIYGRHGYGIATIDFEMEVGKGTTLTAPHLEDDASAITTRFATVTDEGAAERRRRIDLDLLTQNVGTIVGDPDFYATLGHVRQHEILTKEPPRIIWATREGRDVGYAVLHRTHRWQHSRPAAEVEVRGISGAPAARLALLRRLVDLDLSGTIKVFGLASGDPVLSWVAGPRAVGSINPVDGLWIRLADLPGAIAARGYEGSCDVVVEVEDGTAPWNAGRWRIRVSGGTGEATSTEDDAEVSLPVAALGAAYLGSGNLVEMLRAGTVAERRPGAVAELWRALRTDASPYAARGF